MTGTTRRYAKRLPREARREQIRPAPAPQTVVAGHDPRRVALPVVRGVVGRMLAAPER